MALKSGSYDLKTTRMVVAWPAPAHDGDGQEVWQGRQDDYGNEVETRRVLDKWDRPVREFTAPEGFANRPSSDGTPNWVQVTPDGRIFRQSNGAAVNIKPGQAIVLDPKGDVVEILNDEYAQFVFDKLNDIKSESSPDGQASEDSVADDSDDEATDFEGELAALKAKHGVK